VWKKAWLRRSAGFIWFTIRVLFSVIRSPIEGSFPPINLLFTPVKMLFSPEDDKFSPIEPFSIHPPSEKTAQICAGQNCVFRNFFTKMIKD
jgi:hypothetical protein